MKENTEKFPTQEQIEKVMQDPQFRPWLHELTVLGYDQEIMIDTNHGDVITLYFKEGKTPDEALHEYKQFLSRWKALNSQSMQSLKAFQNSLKKNF